MSKLDDMLQTFRRERDAFRALLDDSQERHVYPRHDPLTQQLRYIVIHMPEPWDAIDVCRRVILLLTAVSAAARRQDPADTGTVTVMERCCAVIESVVRYQSQKAREGG